MTRTLDYVARLDERNRNYRLTAPDPDLLQKPKYWTPGYPVLDQGAEGACVGFGCTGEAMASPARVKFRLRYTDTLVVDESNEYARAVYYRAKQIDEFEGVDYDGTSVRAGMLVGRERGWWTGFRWAFNLTELRGALNEGPVIIGVDWHDGMYDAPNGVLTVDGPVAGGHCLVVTGYTPHHKVIGGPAYRLRNSWGDSWGNNGMAYIATADLDHILFQAGGEAAVPIGRAA